MTESPQGNMDDIFSLSSTQPPTLNKINIIYDATNAWANNMKDTSQKISDFITSREDFDVVFGPFVYILTQDDRRNLLLVAGNQSVTIDRVMRTLESKFENLIKDQAGRVFVTTEIDYSIRRNLFERKDVFQQKTFGFEIRYTRPKTTILDLRRWLADESADPELTKFLTVYIMLYMILADIISNTDLTGRSASSKDFTRFWRDKNLTGRVNQRPQLYDGSSWVYHPLTDEEDREYLLELGRELLEKRDSDHKKAMSIEKNLKKISEMTIMNAKVRILCYDIKNAIQTSEFITKNYNVSFSNNIDGYIIQNDADMKAAYDRFHVIVRKLASWKLVDDNYQLIPWIVPQEILDLDTKHIFSITEKNVEYLFSLIDVISGKFATE